MEGRKEEERVEGKGIEEHYSDQLEENGRKDMEKTEADEEFGERVKALFDQTEYDDEEIERIRIEDEERRERKMKEEEVFRRKPIGEYFYSGSIGA